MLHHARHPQPPEEMFTAVRPCPALSIMQGDDFVYDGRSVYLVRRISKSLLGTLVRQGIIRDLPPLEHHGGDGRPQQQSAILRLL